MFPVLPDFLDLITFVIITDGKTYTVPQHVIFSFSSTVIPFVG
jgi:hypothetical protein